MTQFAYLGDHDETQVFGLVFRRGEAVEVISEKHATKLRNNCDFSEVVDGVEALEAEQQEERVKRKYTRKAQ
ncbi:MAG: hypothetical protein KA781_02720 [Aquabacterium sp.]|nr:hypothetical protein [Aquabacterium sp.]